MEAGSLKEECENTERVLSEYLEAHDKSRRDAQERLEKICEKIEASIDEFENRTSSELEEKSAAESNRLQSALADFQTDEDGDSNNKNAPEILQRAKAGLLVVQSYDVVECDAKRKGRSLFDVSSLYELRTGRKVLPEVVEVLRPTGVCASETGNDMVSLRFTVLGPDMLRALSECGTESTILYKCLLTKRGESEGREYSLKAEGDGSFTFTPGSLSAGATYGIRVRAVLCGRESMWSDEVELLQKGGDGTGTSSSKPSSSGRDTKKLDDEEREKTERMLNERIEMHDEGRRAA